MAQHLPAKPNATLPTGSRYSGPIAKVDVAAHVNAYVAKLPAAKAALFWGLPASQQAASAGVHTYQGQYQWRQWLRSSGARANGHWGAGATPSAKVGAGKAANAAARKLHAAATGGARQAKRQGQAAAAEPTAQASTDGTAHAAPAAAQ